MKNLLLFLSFLGTTSLFAQEDNAMVNFAKSLPDYKYELNKTYTFQSGNDVLKVFLDKKGNAQVERAKNNERKSSRIYFLGNPDESISTTLYELIPNSKILENYWFIPFSGDEKAVLLSSSKEPIVFNKICNENEDIQMFFYSNIYIYSDYILDENTVSCKDFFAEREGIKFNGMGVFFPAKSVKFIN